MLNEPASAIVRSSGRRRRRRACFLDGSLDRRPELGPHVLARHGEQIVRGVSWRHAQITVGRSERIEALVFAVDQDRRRRIGLHHQPPAQARPRAAWRDGAWPGPARGSARAPSPALIEKPNSPAGCGRYADRAAPAWRSPRSGRRRCRPSPNCRAAECRLRAARNGTATMTFACASGRR